MNALLFLMLTAAAGDDLIKNATPIKSLDDWLELYMGECTKGERDQIKECQDAAKKFREEAKGKSFVVDLPTRFAQHLNPIESKSQDTLIYEFTPFFDAGGFGMSFEKPKAQGGAPVVRREKLKIPAPKNDEDSNILGAIKVDRLVAQLVFKPADQWKIAKAKGQGFWYGLQVKPVLLRLQDSRSGDIADTAY